MAHLLEHLMFKGSPMISASLGFAGALACVWLAGAIIRRAQRNAEVVAH